jgi:hypothetical protein
MKKPEFFKPYAHGDRRDEEALGKRLRELLEHLVVLIVKIARDLGEGVVNRRHRLQDSLLAIGKCFVPGSKNHLARHQEAGGIEIRLPFDTFLGLA